LKVVTPSEGLIEAQRAFRGFDRPPLLPSSTQIVIIRFPLHPEECLQFIVAE
jgi:hypothetical protein